MTPVQIGILAIVQGLTEFLPVSSSAHLILTSHVLGWPDQGLALDVAVHLGTLFAVLGYFRSELAAIARAMVSRAESDAAMARLGLYVLLAALPIFVAGFLAYDLVSQSLRDIRVIAISTLVFGALLWWADARFPSERQLGRLNGRDALLIGLAQALALVPGVSRSGITMTLGRMLGLEAGAAARFSFLLSIPVISAAAAYSGWRLVGSGQAVDWPSFGLAVVCAAAAGWLCIAAFLALLARVGLLPFILYRLVLGGVLVVIAF